MTERRRLDVNLHDTSIRVWQDDPRDPTFRAEIYLGLLRLLRRRKWRVAADPHTLKHYPSISNDRRLGERGDLRVKIDISGRAIEIEFWAETWPIDNRNGRRYDFDKRSKLNYLDRLRVDLETRKVIAWLERRTEVAVKPRDAVRGVGPNGFTAAEFIARQYVKSWHTDETLGRPVCSYAYNSGSADGGTVEHGATVWFPDPKGRIRRGVAHYNINNMWWVVTDRFGCVNTASFQIFARQPGDLRRKRNEPLRRKRLESELARAIRSSDFRRAELLKHIAFGDGPTYGIWSRKWESYYLPGGSGYTTDSISAGRYTWDEAIREVRRVPHILSLVMPDGRHLEADALDEAQAA